VSGTARVDVWRTGYIVWWRGEGGGCASEVQGPNVLISYVMSIVVANFNNGL
jgi:hypothetical protein